LEKHGVVTASWEDIDESLEGRRRRRYYALTGEGARVARRALAELQPARRAASRPEPA